MIKVINPKMVRYCKECDEVFKSEETEDELIYAKLILIIKLFK